MSETIDISKLEKEEASKKVDEWIESIIFNDYVEYKADLNSKISIKYRTLTTKQSVDVKNRISGIIAENRDITRDLLDTHNIILQLAYAIQDINGKPLGLEYDDKVESLKNKPAVLLDSIWGKYVKFTQDVSEALKDQDVIKK